MIWAIRHKPSGKFLPRSLYYRGGTYTEINDNRPPRLFSTRTAAANCLRHWLAGITTTHQTIQTGPDWASDGDVVWEITPQTHRRAEDMEIVKVRLEIEE